MKVEGVVLAAGLSSRMGTCKMLLKVGEKTVIQNCIEAMYDYCSNIIVVGGYNYSIIATHLKPYKKVTMIINKDYKNGMFSSVKAGLRKVTGERFFLTPGDYPLIQKRTYSKMLECSSNIVIPSYHNKSGHPILVNSNYIKEILSNKNYKSMRDFIHTHDASTLPLHDPGILIDLDTQNEYTHIRGLGEAH